MSFWCDDWCVWQWRGSFVHFNLAVSVRYEPWVPKLFKSRERDTVGSAQFPSNRPESDLAVIVLFPERVQVFRVVVNGYRLTRPRHRRHYNTIYTSIIIILHNTPEHCTNRRPLRFLSVITMVSYHKQISSYQREIIVEFVFAVWGQGARFEPSWRAASRLNTDYSLCDVGVRPRLYHTIPVTSHGAISHNKHATDATRGKRTVELQCACIL